MSSQEPFTQSWPGWHSFDSQQFDSGMHVSLHIFSSFEHSSVTPLELLTSVIESIPLVLCSSLSSLFVSSELDVAALDPVREGSLQLLSLPVPSVHESDGA